MKKNCDHLVIGSGLAAIVYAYLNDALYINNDPEYSPFLFDYFDPEFPLEAFGIEPASRVLKTDLKDRTVGHPKVDLWQRISFVLSLGGNAPFGDKVASLRINPEEKTARIITTGNAALEYEYNNAVIFNPENIHGIVPVPNDREEIFRVEDWFDVRTGGKHQYDYVLTEDEFINEIYFYPSPRMSTQNSKIKDLVAVSYATREQLNNIDYSDVAARFKILSILKGMGRRGARNGRDPKNPDLYKYYAIKIEARRREVFPKTKQVYKDMNGIRFDTRSAEEIILCHSLKENKPYNVLKGLFTL